MGYTQEQLNTPIGTTPLPPDDPGFFGGIGGVTIPMPPPPPPFRNIFGGTPPSGAFGDFLTNLLGGLGEGTGGTRGPSDEQVGDGMPKPPIDVGGPVERGGPKPVLVGGPAYGGMKDATPIKQPFGGGQPPVDDDFISGPRPLPGFDVAPIGTTNVLPGPKPVSGLPGLDVEPIDVGGPVERGGPISIRPDVMANLVGGMSNPMGITPIAPPMGGMGLPSLPQAPVVPNLGPQGPSGGRFSIDQLLGLI
jgi:hypothetical protein